MAGILRDRPLLLFTIGLIVGLSWREYPWNPILILPFLVIVGDWRRSISAVVGVCVGISFSPVVPNSGVDASSYLESPAVVVSVPRLYPDRISYLAEVQGRRIAITEPLQANRSLGDRLAIRGILRPIAEGSENWMYSKGLVGRIAPLEVVDQGRGPAWYRQAASVRKYFVQFSRDVLPAGQAAMLDALCFNVEGGLEPEFEDNLRRTGTIHIISASGLHALILAWAIDLVLGLLPIPRPARLVILGLLLAFYATAAGLQPAIVRSVVMSMVALSAYLWRRESDLLSGLALSTILYLAFEPLGIYNIGFQFSFITVASFALFGRFDDSPVANWFAGVKSVALGALQTTTIAYFATLPLLAFYFGAISLVSVPANLTIVMPAMALVAVGMGSFSAHGILPGVSAIAAQWIISPLLSFVDTVTEYFGSLSIASIEISYFSGYWLLGAYGLMLFWARDHVRPA